MSKRRQKLRPSEKQLSGEPRLSLMWYVHAEAVYLGKIVLVFWSKEPNQLFEHGLVKSLGS